MNGTELRSFGDFEIWTEMAYRAFAEILIID